MQSPFCALLVATQAITPCYANHSFESITIIGLLQRPRYAHPVMSVNYSLITLSKMSEIRYYSLLQLGKSGSILSLAIN